MTGSSYRCIVEDADNAVLFVHGILGTPNHFGFLMPLVPENWSVVNICLDGHGGSATDFSSTSMEKWRNQVSEELRDLMSCHSNVFIVAHSMGTLFAIREAAENQIAGLFLLNTPMIIHPTLRMIKSSLKVFLGKTAGDKWAEAAKDAYGINNDSNPLHYIGWIPRYLELFSEIKATRGIIEKVSCPMRVFLSVPDEMVDIRSANFFRKNPYATVTELKSSGHYYYSPEDTALLREDFQAMITP